MKSINAGRKLNRALTSIAVVCVSMPGLVHAEAIAYASNQLTSFSIIASPGSTITTIGTPQRTTTNFATYGLSGVPGTGVSSQDPQPLGNLSDASQASVGPMQFAGQNNFTRVTASAMPDMVGARADSRISAGSPLAPGGVPSVNNVAEARVTTGLGYAGAGAGTNAANVSFTFDFGILEAGTIEFSFSNLYEIFASTTTFGEAAQGALTNTFSIVDAAGLTVYNYAPDLINTSCASNSGMTSVCDSGPLFATFSGTSGLLAAGNYTISLLTSSAAQVTSNAAEVPEPGTYALFGLGLLSLSLLRRNRRQ